MHRHLALALAVSIALLLPSSALGATWRNVTGNTRTSLTAVSMVRSATSKTLHVVWVAPGTDPDNSNVLYLRDVLANGALGPQRMITMAPGSGSLTNPSIARNPVNGHVWVFNAGASMLEGKLFALTSADDGATWSAPMAISSNGYAYAPANSSAAFASDGTAFQTFGVHFKRTLGVDPAEDDLSNAPAVDAGFDSGCCAAWSQVAVDSLTGQPYVAWFSNLRSGRYGIEVVSPNDGTVTYAPGSADAARKNSANGDQPTPFAARMDGGGVFAAYCGGYPSCASALVWQYGMPKAMLVGTGSGLQHVRVAAAPNGKLWAFWEYKGWLVARRSNAAVTTWGDAVRVKIPGRNQTIWRLAGDGSVAGTLDAFVTMKTGTMQATWTSRVLAGLTLSPPKIAKTSTKLAFKVTDAGAPVSGAKVVFNGASATSNAAGVVTFTAPAMPGLVTATASRIGYAADTVKLRIAS